MVSAPLQYFLPAPECGSPSGSPPAGHYAFHHSITGRRRRIVDVIATSCTAASFHSSPWHLICFRTLATGGFVRLVHNQLQLG